MGPTLIFAAFAMGGLGIACAVWTLRLLTFCRWYHLKKPKWVQELPFADLVMRPWMPTYFRIMGVVLCLFAMVVIWLGLTGGFP
jgi:hypothetical protein